MLAHLVGDLHQPLHVGSVYLDDHDVPVDPGPATSPHDPKMDTRGGNRLEVDNTNLHAIWDEVDLAWDPAHLPRAVIDAARAVPSTSGPVAHWPAAWASETIEASRTAYAGLTFSRDGARKPGDWVTTFPDRAAYLSRKTELQQRELIAAGARLAQALNAIWP